MRHRLVLISLAVLFALFASSNGRHIARCCPFKVSSSVAGDDPATALAGHAAEMAQFGVGADPLRRALYFDSVDLENSPTGVPCDHRAKTRPDTVAGQGVVVLLQDDAEVPRRVRYWVPPGKHLEDASAVARAFASTRWPNSHFRLVAMRAFHWCK